MASTVAGATLFFVAAMPALLPGRDFDPLDAEALAAHRAEIFEVVIPEDNKKDLKDIPERVMKQMTVHPVEHIDQVLKLALDHADPDKFMAAPSETIDWRNVSSTDESDSTAGATIERLPPIP